MQLGAIPEMPVLLRLPLKPTKKDLLLGPVKEKAKKDKIQQQLVLANMRIKNLEGYIVGQRGALEQTHAQLIQTSETGWNYIEAQNKELASLNAQVNELQKQANKNMMDIVELKCEVKAAKSEACSKNERANDKDIMIEMLKKQIVENEKRNKHLSVDDQIRLDNAKAENQIRVAEAKEFTKVDAKEETKVRDRKRQEKNFQANKENYQNNRGNAWNLRNDDYVSIFVFVY